MFYNKTHNFYQPITFLIFSLLIMLFLKPLVTDIPDLFFKGIAQAYLVNNSMNVNIFLKLLLFLFKGGLLIESADLVSI